MIEKKLYYNVTTKEKKEEPVCAINETRYGLEFTTGHRTTCRAKNENCRDCGTTGHFARFLEKKQDILVISVALLQQFIFFY